MSLFGIYGIIHHRIQSYMTETLGKNMQFKSVYHSLDAVLNILRKEEEGLPEVHNLLGKYQSAISQSNTNSLESGVKRQLFVVFEGLDACGKTTISKCVAKELQGIRKSTPPESMLQYREIFDECPKVVRRAFYGLGNYIAALEIMQLYQTVPVFLDRFWHSTAAYGLAHELMPIGGLAALPPKDHPVFRWPSDLLKPDLVLFLHVDENERRIRYERRKQNKTVEEEHLKQNEDFRELVLETYKCMVDPPVRFVDSSVSVRRTVDECVKYIKQIEI